MDVFSREVLTTALRKNPQMPISLTRQLSSFARKRGARRRIGVRTQPDDVTLSHVGLFSFDDHADVGDPQSEAEAYATTLAALAWFSAKGCPTAVIEFEPANGRIGYEAIAAVRDLVTVLSESWSDDSLGEAVGLALCQAAGQFGVYEVEREWRLWLPTDAGLASGESQSESTKTQDQAERLATERR